MKVTWPLFLKKLSPKVPTSVSKILRGKESRKVEERFLFPFKGKNRILTRFQNQNLREPYVIL